MQTLVDPLKRALQIRPKEVAVIDGEKTFTYEELWGRCSRLVGALRNLGSVKGDRIAILSNNSHQYFEAYIGIPAGGMVIVPLNTRHALPELLYALKDSGAKILLTDRSDIGPLQGSVDLVISLNGQYEEILANAVQAPLGEDSNEEDLAGLFYTGGTTGASKGVMLTHRNLIANAFNWLSAVPQSPNDISLVMVPRPTVCSSFAP